MHNHLNGFIVATRGILLTIRDEKNMRLHLIAAIIVLTLSWYLQISFTDIAILFSMFALVTSAEIFNTAIEKICNIFRDKYKLPYEGSRDIRDIAAGAVWINAIIAAIVGILIISKYLS